MQFRRIVDEVTVATKVLYGVEGDLCGLLGAVEDDARAVLGAHVARVARARSVVQVGLSVRVVYLDEDDGEC